MKILAIGFIICLLILTSCGKSSDSTPAESNIPGIQSQLGAGSFSVPCFQNKLASQGIGSTIYSKSTMTFNLDGTGSNDFELYDDAACTNLLASGTVAVLHYETILIDGQQILLMDQDDGGSVMRIWIPYFKSQSAIYFDVDFSDGESGPFISEPTPAEFQGFQQNPAGEGVVVQP